jgi:hypothetical protein
MQLPVPTLKQLVIEINLNNLYFYTFESFLRFHYNFFLFLCEQKN